MKRYRNKTELNRRNFLSTVSKAGLSMSFLQGSTFATGMMLGRAASAQSGGIRRVINVYCPGGAPTGTFVPSDSLVLGATSAPLEAVKDQCIFFSGTSIVDADGGPVGGHGNTSNVFGGGGFDNTFDVELERTLGANSPFPSLLLGVQSNGHGSSTKVGGNEINYQDNPTAAFNRLFNSNVNTSSIGTQRSQSILDVHAAEIAMLQQRLGASERERLDEHLASVETIQARIELQAAGETSEACSDPVWNTGGFVYDNADRTRFNTESELQVDTAVLALQCNLTNVVSIMFGNHQSEHAIPTLNYTGDYHQSIHGGSVSTYTETRAYLTSRVAYLISELARATDEFGNSLLDSTLVIQSTDMGEGNAHTSDNCPMMMAGGGSSIRRGQVVSTDRHMNMFDTASEALGLGSQINQFGTGPITGVIA